MLHFISPTVHDDEAVEIERFRARHRRLLRTQNQTQHSTSANVEDLDVDDGLKRKVSAKWRQKQQTQMHNQQSDGHWLVSAETEMLMGFNAFDFSASPEAFDTEQRTIVCPVDNSQQRVAEVAKQVSSMGFHCASMWEQSLPGIRQPGGPIRQLRTFGQNAPLQSLWRPPVHFNSDDSQRQALLWQPQYYA